MIKLWHTILIVFNKSLNNNKMKLIFKKMILASVLSLAGMTFAQYYPNDDYGNGQYEYYYDDYNYPDDYYYEYPSDYYTNDFYRRYYNDYRSTIVSINWDRFFLEFNLSPVQVQEVRLLNARFSNYGHWHKYYRYNPDRWYYDRFIAMERILGPRIYVVFYQRYYHNYNPIVYYQNYRVKHYRPTVYVTQRYRNVDVTTFRNDGFRHSSRDKSHGNKAEETRGFRDTDQNNRGGFTRENNQSEQSRGFRNVTPQRTENVTRSNNDGFRSGGFRTEPTPQRNDNNVVRSNNDNGFRSGGFRTESAPQQRNDNAVKTDNSGFRSGGFRGSENSSNRSSQATDKSHNGNGRGFR